MEVTNLVQEKAEGELRNTPSLDTNNSSDGDQFDQQPEDTMLYRYPKYNDEAEAEAHVHAFLTTWQGNHVSHRLSKANADKSKIA